MFLKNVNEFCIPLIRRGDSLNDDVAHARDHSKTFAFDDTSGALTKKRLIRGDSNTKNARVIGEELSDWQSFANINA